MTTRPALGDPDLRVWRDQTLYRLLLRASRAETTATLQGVHDAGYRDVTLVDTNLLANLDTDGTTISALARRAGVTRQAASQQVAALERRGYVNRRPSPEDGRAAVIHQTVRGRALLDDALDIVADLEHDYVTYFSATRINTLKKLLAELLDYIDPLGSLGRD
jgi:DNA-binding MarR family transcriptional regulator